MRFSKWQGCGNDFVLVDCFKENVDDFAAFAKQVCDRHYGIGGDGVAVVEWPSQCPEAIPETHLAIRLTPVDETTRDVTITPMGGFREISLEEEQ